MDLSSILGAVFGRHGVVPNAYPGVPIAQPTFPTQFPAAQGPVAGQDPAQDPNNPSQPKKPQGKMAKIGNALTRPDVSTFLLSMAAGLGQPAQPGQSQLQRFSGGLLNGYAGLSALAQQQALQRQQQFENSIAAQKVVNDTASTGADVKLKGAQTTKTKAEEAGVYSKIGTDAAEVDLKRKTSMREDAEQRRKQEQTDANVKESEQRIVQMQKNIDTSQKRVAILEKDLNRKIAEGKDKAALDRAQLRLDGAKVKIADGHLGIAAAKLQNEIAQQGDEKKLKILSEAQKAAAAELRATSAVEAMGQDSTEIGKKAESLLMKYYNQFTGGEQAQQPTTPAPGSEPAAPPQPPGKAQTPAGTAYNPAAIDALVKAKGDPDKNPAAWAGAPKPLIDAVKTHLKSRTTMPGINPQTMP